MRRHTVPGGELPACMPKVPIRTRLEAVSAGVGPLSGRQLGKSRRQQHQQQQQQKLHVSQSMMLPILLQVGRRQALAPRFTSSLHHGVNRIQSRWSPTTVSSYSTATMDAFSESQKKKGPRSPAVQRSLRRVAVEAERTRTKSAQRPDLARDINTSRKGVTAICVAEEFAMGAVVRILRSQGYPIDPHGTGFLDDQVVHTRFVAGGGASAHGDVFIFPSGTVVSWSLPEELTLRLATETLMPAAINPHADQVETEDLEYEEDASRDTSHIKGDIITLGTKDNPEDVSDSKTATTLVQIAFSSGLARSTKLAVLETSLGKYLDSTRPIPPMLSRGKRLPFNQQFILQKTGALLELRAQLNHYSELTDSLPDLFWDSRYELGLENYYEQVGKALDVAVRIRSLNTKMDYAHEIVSILRETLSQSHSAWLEWIIIVLIAIEIGFELKREFKERMKLKEEEAAHN